jgi:hypothetical protein
MSGLNTLYFGVDVMGQDYTPAIQELEAIIPQNEITFSLIQGVDGDIEAITDNVNDNATETEALLESITNITIPTKTPYNLYNIFTFSFVFNNNIDVPLALNYYPLLAGVYFINYVYYVSGQINQVDTLILIGGVPALEQTRIIDGTNGNYTIAGSSIYKVEFGGSNVPVGLVSTIVSNGAGEVFGSVDNPIQIFVSRLSPN